MFSNQVLDENKSLRQEWEERCSKLYEGKEFKATSASGIPVKPVYAPSDIEDTDFSETGMPGEYPYTRGIYPLHYQFQPWVSQPTLGYALPEQTRERRNLLVKEGMEGYFGVPSYNYIYDIVTKHGLDPDDPQARGFVGHGGVSLSTIEDMDRLFRDLPLDKVTASHNVEGATLVELAMFIAYAEKRGFAQEELRGISQNFLYHSAHDDVAVFPPKNSFKLMVEIIKYCSGNMPRWNPFTLNGYQMEEAGANAVQEIAINLSAAIAIIKECIKAGLSPDEFMPRFGFMAATGSDFFEEVAKIRAERRMWAKIARERFGCKNPKSMQLRLHVHTAGRSLVPQQPLNNVIRVAFQTLSAVFAGTNAIAPCAYDEPLALPTEQAATLALRTQQIILYETNIPNVSDPLAGSYYVEWLTNRVEEEANKVIAEIEQLGGYIQCWETGWFKRELERENYNLWQSIDNGERIVVGVNKYVSKEEEKIPIFKFDPGIEEIAIERVQQFRAKRDNDKVKAALQEMKEVAKKVNEDWPYGGDLIPSVIKAARADATLGEMQSVLKEIFGWGYAY